MDRWASKMTTEDLVQRISGRASAIFFQRWWTGTSLARAAACAILLSSGSVARAQSSNPCDLNGDGVVNSADVKLASNMTVGLTPCTANVAGPSICSAVTVQRIANASLPGGTCLAHWVSLSWVASISPNIAGYNVYRSASASGPFVKVNTSLVTAVTYIDAAVRAGQTFYYVATAVDTNGQESVFSTQAMVTVPTP